MTIAMVFPGQGSQSQGMQSDLAEAYPAVADTYAEASDILGYDLWALVQDGTAEELGKTTVTQPAMLTAGFAAWRCWNAAGGSAPQQMAGHSLGEYTALTCAGAVSFEDALRVVMRRSELMQEAVPAGEGAMAAILGIDDQVVIEVCQAASTDGVADAVNFNSPGQVVIAGHVAAVDKAIELAKARGARRAMFLPVSVPSHSTLMRAAGESLQAALADANFEAPPISVICACDGAAYGDADDIRRRLSLQVYSPVQWVQTVQAMLAGGASRVVECGPGKVLTGLMRRIDRDTPTAFIDSNDSLQQALQS
ncbi:MAG: ACP S-malonyltransferase [Woeseiaceae bacterium]